MALGEKGKYASATENRRFVWKELVWPLILETDDTVFTVQQYHAKRDELCRRSGLSITKLSRGMASLMQKGLIYKDKQLYGIHFRLVPYMRLKAKCDYATAVHEVQMRYG